MLGMNLTADAKVLLEHCLKSSSAEIYLNGKNVSASERKIYKKYILKRKSGIPAAYLTGSTEFMGLNFFINRDVLIPRQDTEILVEEVIRILPTSHFPLPAILDIGTGSGNVAVSLAKYINNSKIVATDISNNALKVARKNAKLNNVSDKITFLQCDLFPTTYHLFATGEPTRPLTAYDIIVSNPPYVRTSEIPKLQKEIQHEPYISLNGGKDGLDFYEKIIYGCRRYLKKNGFLIFEIGYHHSKKIKKMMDKIGLKNINIEKDYSGLERVIYGQNCN